MHKKRTILVIVNSRKCRSELQIPTACNKDNLIFVKTEKHIKDTGKWIEFALLNTRSVRNKSPQIQDFVIENKLDFLAITETWLKEEDESDIIDSLTPNGYTLLHRPRIGKTGGGVGLLVKTNIKVKVVPSKRFQTFEHQEYLLKFKAKSIRLIVLYRPPTVDSHTVSDFCNEFGDYLSHVSAYPESLLILGDFNIHLDNAELADTVSFNVLFNIHHVIQKTIKSK